MVNKASQELTGVYIKRFENISFSLKLILDWNSHASSPMEETDIGSLSVPGAGAVCSVRSRSQTVLEIEFITICFPNDILWS